MHSKLTSAVADKIENEMIEKLKKDGKKLFVVKKDAITQKKGNKK